MTDETPAPPLGYVVGYRDWAKSMFARAGIGRQSSFHTGPVWEYIELDPPHKNLVNIDQPPTIYVGWSKIIPHSRWSVRDCYVLHPSRLPLYRGGSPIQHQIIDGVADSAVSIFRITSEDIDAGPLVYQAGFRLEGAKSLGSVFDRIITAGAPGLKLIAEAYRDGVRPAEWPQPEGDWPVYKRRTPDESEITPELVARGPEAVDRFFVALQPPYPEPFVRVGDMRFRALRQ